MTVNLSFSGIGDMLSSPEMQAEMRRRAEKVADAARAAAPVGPATDGTHYKDSFEVTVGVRQGESRRAYAEVRNDTEYAAAIEFGNYRTRKKTIEAHHVLGIALDAAKD